MGGVVAGGVQRIAGGQGQGVACGSGTSGRGGREGRMLLRVYSNCVALKGMHAVARVLPSGALVVLDVHVR